MQEYYKERHGDRTCLPPYGHVFVEQVVVSIRDDAGIEAHEWDARLSYKRDILRLARALVGAKPRSGRLVRASPREWNVVFLREELKEDCE